MDGNDPIDKAIEELPSWLNNTRATASFFAAPNAKQKQLRITNEEAKSLVELEVSKRLAIHEKEYSGACIESVAPHEDPPDCIMMLPNRNIIGIEISEFVDEQTCHHNSKSGHYKVYRPWGTEEICERCCDIIWSKELKIDSKISLKHTDSMFSEFILLIHSDEFSIDYPKLLDVKTTFRYNHFNRIRRVYFLTAPASNGTPPPLIRLH